MAKSKTPARAQTPAQIAHALDPAAAVDALIKRLTPKTGVPTRTPVPSRRGPVLGPATSESSTYVPATVQGGQLVPAIAPYKPGLVPVHPQPNPRALIRYHAANKQFDAFLKTHPGKTLNQADWATYAALRKEYNDSVAAVQASLDKPPTIVDVRQPVVPVPPSSPFLPSSPFPHPTAQVGLTPAQKGKIAHDLAAAVVSGKLTKARAEANAKELGLKGFKLDTSGLTLGDIARGAVEEAKTVPARAGAAFNLLSPVAVHGGHATFQGAPDERVGRAIVDALTSPGVTNFGKEVGAGALGAGLRKQRQAYEALTGRDVQPSGLETRVTEAGILPADVNEALYRGTVEGAKGVGKAFVGAAGGLYGLRHPEKGVPAFARDIGTMLYGFTQLAGLAISPESPAAKKQQALEVVKGMAETAVQQYGPDASISEVFQAGQQNPGIYISNLIAVVDPAVRVGLLAKLRAGGLTWGDAWKAVSTPEKPRTLTYQTPGRELPFGGRGTPGELQTVDIQYSRSPLVRGVVQRPADAISRLADAVPGVRRTPIAMRKRFAKAKERELATTLRRLPVEVRRLVMEVENYVKDMGPEFETALAVALQKPANFTNGEFITAALRDMEEMLGTTDKAGRPIERMSGEAMSPAMRRRMNQIRRYRTKYENQLVRRRARAGKRVLSEQTRLADAVDELQRRQQALHDEALDIDADETLSAKDKREALRQVDAEIRGVSSQLGLANDELKFLTADQPAIEHPARTDLREKAIARGMDEAGVDTALAATDARARVWGKQTGRDPGEWYAGLETRNVGSAAEIPEGALRQSINLPPLDELKRIAFEGVDLSVFREHDIGGFLEKIPEYLTRGAPYRKWYERSGKAILGFAQGDREFGSRVAGLVAIYSASRDPVENINLATQALREWQENRRITAGTEEQVKKATKAMEGKEWEGRKTNRFYGNLLRWIDPVRYEREFPGGAVTNDIWMARLFKLKTDQPTPREYTQMERIIQNVAGELGWLPEEVQAALWVPAKADAGRMVTTGARKGERNPMTDAEAGTDFADALSRESAQIPIEAAPGRRVAGQDYLRRYDALVPEQKLAYTREKMQAVVDFLREAQVFGRLEGEGAGLYKNETNPAFLISIPLSGIGRDISLRTRVDASVINQLIGTIGEALNQDAMAWFRPFYRKAGTNEHGAWITLPRALTEEETLALARAIKQGLERPLSKEELALERSKLEKRLGRPANRDELAELRARRTGGDIALPPGPGNDLYALNFSGRTTTKFHQEVQKAIHEVFPGEEEVGYTRFSFTGDLRTRSRWYGKDRRTPSFTGRPDVREAAHRLRARSDEVDRQYLGEPGGPGASEAPTPPLAPVRRQDVRGAIQWIDSEAGRRILYLTPRADPSTLLHELLGHATDEMRTYYPEQFAEVEAYVGKPLADWDAADHERFATWLERYFADGYAPTPELTGPFERMKTWMQTIYAGIKAALGPRLPYETRILFDSYFGAYDDVNVARITHILTGERWKHTMEGGVAWITTPASREGAEIQQVAGTVTNLENEAAAIRKRSETRSYKKSLDSLVAQTEAKARRLTKLAEKKKSAVDWTQAELDEYRQLAADVLQGQADIVVKTDKRKQLLDAKISDLRKALEKGVDNRRFDGALEAMAQIVADRERILREVFGDDFNDTFTNRVDLLANWLVSQKLLTPEFAQGTATYFPMVGDIGLGRALAHHAAPLIGGNIGKARAMMLSLHHRNEMIRWQSGDWSADPRVLLESWQNAQAFAWMYQVKELLHQLGRPLHAQDLQPGKLRGMTLINKDGTPLGPIKSEIRRAQARLGDASSTYSNQSVIEAIEGANNNIKEGALAEYFKSFAIDPDHIPAGFDPLAHDVRVVPTDILLKILRPLKGPQSLGGQILDLASAAARFSLIYANVPGYVIANLPANIMLSALHAGPFAIPTAMKLASRVHHNPHLGDVIDAEMGSLPAESFKQPGRGFNERVRDAEGWWTKHLLNWVDRWPRRVAWAWEAQKAGYKSDDDWIRLAKGATDKTARDRARVQHFAVNHMYDFDRVGPWEKQVFSRAMFIWPFIRAATAWPFWYAKNYPGRTAVLAAASGSARERQKRLLGTGQIKGKPYAPPWYEDLYPMSVNAAAGTARVTRAGIVSPTAVAAQELRTLEDTIASAAGRKPGNLTSRLIGMVQPTWSDMLAMASGRDSIGRDMSLQDLFKQTIFDVTPGLRIARALVDADQTPRVFRVHDRGVLDRTLRTLVRINGQTASLPWLHQQAILHGDTTPAERIQQKVNAAAKDLTTIGAPGGVDGTQRFWIKYTVLFEDAQKEYARRVQGVPSFEPTKTEHGTWSTAYQLSTFEKGKVAYETLKQLAPAIAADVTDPVADAARWGYKPGTASADLSGKQTLDDIRKLEEAATHFSKTHTKATKVRKITKLTAEAAAG